MVAELLKYPLSSRISHSSFKDPQGEFTIDYPTGWGVTTKEDRFSLIVQGFTYHQADN